MKRHESKNREMQTGGEKSPHKIRSELELWDLDEGDRTSRNGAKDSSDPPEKRSGAGRVLLTVTGALFLATLALYLGTAAYVKLNGGREDAQPVLGTAQSAQQGGGASAELPSADGAIYTQAEVDALVANAQAYAVLEGAEGRQEEILDAIRTDLSEGKSMVDTLRPFYPNHLILASNGSVLFVPVSDTLPKHPYKIENLLIDERGFYTYQEDDQIISHKGIDVSKFQGAIDWKQVAADGVEFAFIRIGSRGYGAEGKLIRDETFQTNIEGASAAGIAVGAYFYTQALTDAEVLEEAQLVLNSLAPYQISCPVVVDVEKVSGANGRMNNLTVEERTRLVKLFLDTLQDAGYRVMLYHNMEMALTMIDLEQLVQYDKWFAYYRPDMYFPYAYDIWQYSAEGRVNGIKGDVDLNISFSKFWE